jgi:predicted DNA-binding transcriptional regulator AlpA
MSLMTQAWLLDKYGPRLNVDQMCQVLGMARQTINNQISDGSFPVPTYRDVGKRWADYRDVDAYLDRCREAVAAETA